MMPPSSLPSPGAAVRFWRWGWGGDLKPPCFPVKGYLLPSEQISRIHLKDVEQAGSVGSTCTIRVFGGGVAVVGGGSAASNDAQSSSHAVKPPLLTSLLPLRSLMAH